MKRKITTALFCLTVLTFVSCKTDKKSEDVVNEESVESVSEKETSSSSEETSESNSIFDHPKFTDKYNEYIGFQNSFNMSVNSSYNYYYSRFDSEKPISDGNLPSIRTLSSYALNSLRKAIDEEPSFGDIDKNALVLCEKSKTLDSLLTTAKFYYDKKGYQDDNFERAKELNDLTLSAFEEYFIAYSKITEEIREMGDALTQISLKEYKDSGLNVRYDLLATIVEAEKLVYYIEQGQADQFKSISLETIDSLVVKMNIPLEDLEKLSLDEELLEKEIGFRSSSVSTFLRHASGLIREAKNFKERVEKNNWETSITHPTIPDDGTVEKIAKEYEDLINDYNSMFR